MTLHALAVLFIGATSFGAGFIQGAMAFGDAIVFHLCYRLVVFLFPALLHSTALGDNDLEAATLLLTIRAVPSFTVLLYLSRNDIQFRFAGILCPVVVAFDVVGSLILYFDSRQEWVRVLLGVMLLSCASFFWYFKFLKPCREDRALTDNNSSRSGRGRQQQQQRQTVVLVHHNRCHAIRTHEENNDDEEANNDHDQEVTSKEEEQEMGRVAGVGGDDDDDGNINTPTAAAAAAGEAIMGSSSSSSSSHQGEEEEEEDDHHQQQQTQQQQQHIQRLLNSRRFLLCMLVCAAISGFQGGMTNVGPPPLMIGIIAFNVPRQLARGIFPLIFFVVSLLRFGGTAIAGHIYDFPKLWDFYLSVSLGGVLGIMAGNLFKGRLGERFFALCTLWLITFAGLALAELPLAVVLLALVVCVGSLCTIAFGCWETLS